MANRTIIELYRFGDPNETSQQAAEIAELIEKVALLSSVLVLRKDAGRIEAAGETKFVDISSTGAGKIDTGRLRAERAKVSVAGAASVDVYASQQLDVTVSGVGQVTYDGNPGVVNKSVSGLGSVNKKGS